MRKCRILFDDRHSREKSVKLTSKEKKWSMLSLYLIIKKDKDGRILRYKARLVARGFTQKHGVNYGETFAPTIRLDAMRIILALAAKKGWKVHQMDAVAAFLAARLQERDLYESAE